MAPNKFPIREAESPGQAISRAEVLLARCLDSTAEKSEILNELFGLESYRTAPVYTRCEDRKIEQISGCPFKLVRDSFELHLGTGRKDFLRVVSVDQPDNDIREYGRLLAVEEGLGPKTISAIARCRVYWLQVISVDLDSDVVDKVRSIGPESGEDAELSNSVTLIDEHEGSIPRCFDSRLIAKESIHLCRVLKSNKCELWESLRQLAKHDNAPLHITERSHRRCPRQ